MIEYFGVLVILVAVSVGIAVADRIELIIGERQAARRKLILDEYRLKAHLSESRMQVKSLREHNAHLISQLESTRGKSRKTYIDE